MLKRKMLDKLIAWKQKAGGREALLIEGVSIEDPLAFSNEICDLMVEE